MNRCKEQDCLQDAIAFGVYCIYHSQVKKKNGYKPDCFCGARATFAPKNQRSIRCKKHKEDGDLNTKYKYCIMLDCRRRAIFRFFWGKWLYCGEHAPDGDLIKRDDTCDFGRCCSFAYYRYRKIRRKRCSAHSL